MKDKATFNPLMYDEVINALRQPDFLAYIDQENKVLTNILKELLPEIIIDLGAGYGRLINMLSPLCSRLLCVEINQFSCDFMQSKQIAYPNLEVILTDMTIDLKNSLPNNLLIQDKIVFLLCQNTLGTIYGKWEAVIDNLKQLSLAYPSRYLVISLFRKNALKNIGTAIYTETHALTGYPDMSKSDFDKGLFVSTTGYHSKWWSDDEIEQIITQSGGIIIAEKKDLLYHILYLQLK